MKDVGCETYTTISQSQQWAFTSESKSTTPIQTERSDEGGKTGQKIHNQLLLLINCVFCCKNLDNIISGPQRTVQTIKRQFMTLLCKG